MILNPATRVRILSGGQYTMRLQSLHRAYPSLHPFGVVHWVPEQLNIKAVIGACKLIDGCSLVLCLATDSVVSAGLFQEIKSIQLHDSIEGLSQKIVSSTLHYITYPPFPLGQAVSYQTFISSTLHHTHHLGQAFLYQTFISSSLHHTRPPSGTRCFLSNIHFVYF